LHCECEQSASLLEGFELSMLVINRQQQTPLFDYELQKFIARMKVHIAEHFPEHSKALDDPQQTELIQYGIDNAGKYNIVTERDVCIYIDLMFALSPDFDVNEKFSWAEPILNDESLSNAGQKVDALYNLAIEVLE